MCSASRYVVTIYVYIFIYSKHKYFIPQCQFSIGVCTCVLHKHTSFADPCTVLSQVCQENSYGIFFSTRCDRIELLFEDCYIFKQQIKSVVTHERRKTSISASSFKFSFWLVQSQLKALLRSMLSIWNKHCFFLFASFLNQKNSNM